MATQVAPVNGQSAVNSYLIASSERKTPERPILIAQAAAPATTQVDPQEKAMDDIVLRLGDQDWKVRSLAIDSAVRTGAAIVDKLIDCLTGGNSLQIECAMKAIIKMGSVSLPIVFKKVLDIDKSGNDPYVRVTIESTTSTGPLSGFLKGDVIAKMSAETIRVSMLDNLKSNDDAVRVLASNILFVQSGPEKVPAGFVPFSCFKVSDLPFLIGLLNDKNRDVRYNTEYGIGGLCNICIDQTVRVKDWSINNIFDIRTVKVNGNSVAVFLVDKFLEEKDQQIKSDLSYILNSISWIYSKQEVAVNADYAKDPRWAILALIRSTGYESYGYLTWDGRDIVVARHEITRTIPNNIINDPMLKKSIWVWNKLSQENRSLLAKQLGTVSHAGDTTASWVCNRELEYTIGVALGSLIPLGLDEQIERVDHVKNAVGADDWAGSYKQEEVDRLFREVKIPHEVAQALKEQK